MKDIDILVSGYPSVDKIIYVDNSVELHKTSIIKNDDFLKSYIGGCSINISVILSNFGKKALPVVKVGKDFESSGFSDFLKSYNVSLEGIQKVPEVNTSSSLLIEDTEGNHITLFYKGAMDKTYDFKIDEELIKRSSYLAITVGEKEYNKKLVEYAVKNDVPIIFGMKCDFDAFDCDLLREIICNSSLIFMNDCEKKEIEKIFEISDITNLFEITKKLNCIVITQGIEPTDLIYKKNNEIIKNSIDVIRLKNVVDTTGAGDAYMSGFIYGFLNKDTYENCAKIGSVTASFIIEKKGCLENVPNINQIKNRLIEYYGG